MNDHPKHNPRLRQTVIVAVCVLAVLLFLYLLLRDRPGSASDYLDDSAPYTFDSSASRTFRTVDSRLAVVSSSGLQLLEELKRQRRQAVTYLTGTSIRSAISTTVIPEAENLRQTVFIDSPISMI